MTSSSTTTPHIAHTLLLHAHPPDLASSIFTEKVLHKPLRLRGTSPNPTSHDARAQRRLQRLRKKEKEKEKEKALSKAERKAKPLSAKQKRVSGIYDIPPRARKYDVYISLHRMWVGYMWEVLGLRGGNGDGNGNGNGNGNGKGGGEGVVMGGGKAAYVTAQSAGKVLAAADFHGAEVMVVRSRCVGMVGLAGIVVRDTKFTFQVITKGNQLKTIPKRHTVFRVELEQASAQSAQDGSTIRDTEAKLPNLVFELYGSQFENRAPDRATKKFKAKHLADL